MVSKLRIICKQIVGDESDNVFSYLEPGNGCHTHHDQLCTLASAAESAQFEKFVQERKVIEELRNRSQSDSDRNIHDGGAVLTLNYHLIVTDFVVHITATMAHVVPVATLVLCIRRVRGWVQVCPQHGDHAVNSNAVRFAV